jgi:hypothetical protein
MPLATGILAFLGATFVILGYDMHFAADKLANGLTAFIRWAESEGARAEYKQVADRLKGVKAKALGV